MSVGILGLNSMIYSFLLSLLLSLISVRGLHIMLSCSEVFLQFLASSFWVKINFCLIFLSSSSSLGIILFFPSKGKCKLLLLLYPNGEFIFFVALKSIRLSIPFGSLFWGWEKLYFFFWIGLPSTSLKAFLVLNFYRVWYSSLLGIWCLVRWLASPWSYSV